MEIEDKELPAPVLNRDTIRAVTYQDVFPKSKWIESERYFNFLPENVQNMLCQVKEQEAYVRLAQEMTEEMETLECKEKNDPQSRLQKARERVQRKLKKIHPE